MKRQGGERFFWGGGVGATASGGKCNWLIRRLSWFLYWKVCGSFTPMLSYRRADKVSACIMGRRNCRLTENTERTFSWHGDYVASITASKGFHGCRLYSWPAGGALQSQGGYIHIWKKRDKWVVLEYSHKNVLSSCFLQVECSSFSLDDEVNRVRTENRTVLVRDIVQQGLLNYCESNS